MVQLQNLFEGGKKFEKSLKVNTDPFEVYDK